MPSITAASTQPAFNPVLTQSLVRYRLKNPVPSVVIRYAVLFYAFTIFGIATTRSFTAQTPAHLVYGDDTSLLCRSRESGNDNAGD